MHFPLPRMMWRCSQSPLIPIGGTLSLILISFALAACATTQTTTRTDLRLTMLIEQDDSTTLYRVDRDGTIGFGGGYDARMRSITWTDALRDNEIESLQSLLRDPFWRERRRATERLRDGERRFTIDVAATNLRNRTVIKVEPDDSPPEQVREMEGILREAASRRLARDLDALPRGGERPQ